MADLVEVSSNLRSVLESSRRPILLKDLMREYKLLNGHDIPYKTLGYNTLEYYLKSIPEVVRLFPNQKGDLSCEAVLTQATAHVASLVSQQRGSKTSRGSKGSSRFSSKPPQSSSCSSSSHTQPSWSSSSRSKSAGNKFRSDFQSHVNVSSSSSSQPIRNYNLQQQHRAQDSSSQQHNYGRQNQSHNFPRSFSPNQKVEANNAFPSVVPYNRTTYPQNSVPRARTPEFNSNNSAPASSFPPVVPYSVSKTYKIPPRFRKPPERSTQAISPIPTTRVISPLPTTRVISTLPTTKAVSPLPTTKAVSPLPTSIVTREATSAKKAVEQQTTSERITDAKNFKAELEAFAQTHNLGSVTSKVQYTTVHGVKNFFGMVKVGNKSFSTYPIEKFSFAEAQDEAFKCALEDLKAQKRVASNIPISSVEYITRRLIEILTPKLHGIWINYLPVEYTKTFNEHLPGCWEDILKKDNNFIIESVGEGRSIVKVKAVQHDYKDVRRSSIISDGSVHSEASTSSGSPQPNLTNDSPQPNLTALTLPSQDFWEVYVTVVNTVSDVYIRLVGEEYSVKFNDLANEMDLFYMTVRENLDLNVPVVSVGDLRATEVNADWHRVKVTELIDDNTVLCLFVDHGDSDEIPIENLYPLDSRFMNLPFQALQCQLAGLEHFDDHFYTNLIDIVGRSFYAKVVSRDEGISLILYDTTMDEDVDLNLRLKEKFLNEIHVPKLKDPANGVTNVFLSHATASGDIFLQIDSGTFEILESIVDDAAEKSQENKVESVEQNRMYLGRYPVDEQWYRVVSLPGNVPSGEKQVDVFFVDYGNIDRIPISDLMLLDTQHEKLIKFPPQAIRCRLNNVPESADFVWTEKTTERLVQLAPDDYPLIAKVVLGSGDTDIPLVELFKRIEPSNELVSVNQTLSHDQDLFSKKLVHSKANSIVRRRSSLDLKCSSPTATVATTHENVSPMVDIPSIDLPPVGSSIDVHITLASNPYHFMMQPWLGGEALDRLVLDMKAHYDEQGRSVNVDDVVDYGIYAVKYRHIWYRVRVQFNEGFKHAKMVSAFFIDYGDHDVVEVDSLRILDNEFRYLPAQILRGRLGCILPKDNDWRPEDCVIFREMTEEKQFVAEILDVKDINDEKQLVVQLINTSNPEKNVYIHHLLIDSGIAVLEAKTM